MSDRRSAYTGSDNEHLLSQVKEAATQHDEFAETPMKLLNDVARMFHRLIEAESPTQHMQNSNRFILHELARRGGLCQLDLSRLTHLKPPTISVALRKLEEEGYVIRVVDDNDMRTTRVYLTEKGLDIDKTIHSRIAQIDNCAIAGLSEDECATMTEILNKIRHNLEDATGERVK